MPVKRKPDKSLQTLKTVKVTEDEEETLEPPPVSPTKFTANANFRTMEYELTPKYQTLFGGFIMVLLSPLFFILVSLAWTVRWAEKVFASSFLRDLYHSVNSSITMVPGPVKNGPKLPKNPPITEVLEFEAIKSPWFIFRIVTGTVLLILKGGLTCAKVRLLNDLEFGDYINKTLFAQYLVKKYKDGEDFYVLELDELKGLKTWSGTFLSASTTLFRRSFEGKLIPVSISLENGCTFYPDSQPQWKWKLAKLFVMQGLVYTTIVGRHPHHHFPYDVVNYATKKILHPSHSLYKLLVPHFRFSMVLNIMVLSDPNSVLFPDWWKPYYSLTLDSSEIFGKLMERGWEKWSFQRYPTLSTEFVYGYSLMNYYNCIRRFIARLSPHIPRDDFVLQWGNEIAQHLSGFPSGFDLVKDEELFVDILTMVIFTVSVHHCADHYCFSHLDQRVLPFRLRIPPPSHSSNAKSFDENELMTRLDFLKQIHFQNIGAYPGKVQYPFLVEDTSLIKVDYKFPDIEMKQAQEVFKTELKQTAAWLNGQVGDVIPLEDMVCSIEF